MRIVDSRSVLSFVAGALCLLCSCSVQHEGNLLTLESIEESFGVVRDQRLVDGIVPAGDSPIDDFTSALFTGPDARVVLSVAPDPSASFLQVIALDRSIDIACAGASGDYVTLPLSRGGMSGRMTVFTADLRQYDVRFLRVSVRAGSTGAAVAEITALADVPTAVPASVAAQEPATYSDAVDAVLSRNRLYRLAAFALCLGALPLFFLMHKASRRVSVVLALVLAVAGLAGWIRYGSFHGDGSILHQWELAHYYLGPKYFDELKYTGLYGAIVSHETQSGRAEVLRGATVRDLSSNTLVPLSEIDVSASFRRFTPDRWDEFRSDADSLRRLFKYRHFHKLLVDHGYNGTPLNTLVLSGVTRVVRPIQSHLTAAAVVDTAFAVLSIAVLWWAFGPVTAALAALVFGLSHDWSFSWTGGGLGRHLWVLCLCCGTALLKKNRPFAGSTFVALAGMLRLFPLVFLAGLGVSVLSRWWVRKRATGSGKVLMGIVLAVAAGVVLPSLLLGTDSYPLFINNIQAHGKLPPGNHLGLGVICSAGLPGSVLGQTGEVAASGHLIRRAFWLGGVLISLSVISWCAISGRFANWTLVALSAPIVFAAIPLSNYDYMWLVVLAPLASVTPYRASALLGLVALTNILPEGLSDTSMHCLVMSIFLLPVIGWIAGKAILDGFTLSADSVDDEGE